LKNYRSGNPPSDPAALPDFLRLELQSIQKAALAAEPYIELQVMNVTPGKTLTGIFMGAGAPTFAAGKGSLYLRSDGSSTSTRAYINTDGSTTWTNLTTAA
jgi:hypothetical protein